MAPAWRRLGPFTTAWRRGLSSPAGPQRKSPIGWMSLGLTGLSAGALYLYYRRELERKLHGVKTLGTPDLGGPFELVDGNGDHVRDTDLHGGWSIFYFGFTKCPDICPDELEKLSDVVDRLDKSLDLDPPLRPVFISVDPKRDTPERLKAYFAQQAFHPRLMALTGSAEAIEAVARAYRIYYSKPTEEEAKRGDYLIDHSIIMYLIDPEGHFVSFYGKNFTATEVADKCAADIRAWQADRAPPSIWKQTMAALRSIWASGDTAAS